MLLARGADANVTSKAVDLQKHIPLDRASNQRFAKVLEGTAGKNGKPSPNQLQAAVQASRELYASGKLPEPEKPAAGATGGQGQGGQMQFFEETPGLSSKGGLTALLHAARQGHLEAATALLDGGADVNAASAGDGTSPLLIATINGQFDMAMLLLERGADPESGRQGERRDARSGRPSTPSGSRARASRSPRRWSCRRPPTSMSWPGCSRRAPTRTRG